VGSTNAKLSSWQCIVKLTYEKSDTSQAVGVMGDKRVDGYIIILRAVRTTDFMTAEAYEFEIKFLKQVCPPRLHAARRLWLKPACRSRIGL
jgi:GMP synthase PP-ATPase subunit